MDPRIVSSLAGPHRGSSNPLLLIAAFYAAGILAVSQYAIPLAIPFAAFVFFAVLARASYRRKFNWVLIAGLALTAGAAGHLAVSRQPAPDSVKHLLQTGTIRTGDAVEVEGQISAPGELLPDGWLIDLAVSGLVSKGRSLRATGTIRLYLRLGDEEANSEFVRLELGSGSLVKIAAVLEREQKYNNPGGFDFLGFLDREGVDAVGLVKSPLLIEKTGSGKPTASGFMGEIRNQLVSAVLTSLPQPVAGLSTASLLGNRHYLTKESAEVFRKGGTFHLLVISGLHVTFAGGILYWLLSGAGAGRRTALIFACLGVWLLAGLSGAGTPVIRAALMFSVLTVSNILGRPGSGINGLGACVLLILVFDPGTLFEPSFQLTAVSVYAIVAFALPLTAKCRETGAWSPSASDPLPPRATATLRLFCEVLYWDEPAWRIQKKEAVWDCELPKSSLAVKIGGSLTQRVLRGSFEGLVVSGSIMLFLLPLQVHYFHRITLAAPFLNLPSGAFLVLQNSLAIVSVLASMLSTELGESFAEIAVLVVYVWTNLQSAISGLPGLDLRVPIYTGVSQSVYFLFYLPVLYLNYLVTFGWNPSDHGSRSSGRPFLALVSTFAFFWLIVLHPGSEPIPEGRLHVHFLDVGQGDSIFIQFPDGATMLIDGGGNRPFESVTEADGFADDSFEPDRRGVGESVVSEYLWQQGYSSLDYLVSTHSDADHLQGLLTVAENFKIGTLFYGPEPEPSSDREKLVRKVFEQGGAISELFGGAKFDRGGASVNFLSAIERARFCGNSDNDLSIVVLVEAGVRKFLLTGDIESCGESVLLNSEDLKADVVKVPHHGSRTSSTDGLVREVSAEYAIIAAGRRSRFGHPHKEVVERWSKNGTRVLETANSGTITLSTDGSNLELTTFLEH